MPINRTLALLLAASLAGAASAVVWRHDLTDALTAERLGYLLNPVARITPDGTGTLIAPTWVLTAAHVAARLEREGGAVMLAGKRYAVKRVVLHPQGRADPRFPNRPPEVDLGLLELAETAWGVAPIGVYRGRNELGQRALLVGYGDHGPAGAPLTRGDGLRRAVYNVVADAGPMRLFFPFDEPPGGDKFEGIGAAGDSGGPALIVEGGVSWVAGVSSGADGPPGAYGTTDIYARVSSHLDWIDATTSPCQNK
jgi:hypothetical protein